MRSPTFTRLKAAALLVVLYFALAGLFSAAGGGCATSKPFAVGISTAAPKLERDLRHYAAADAIHAHDVDVFLAAAKAPTPDPAAVNRAWTPIKAWYSAAIDADATLDAEARRLRHKLIDDTDKTIANELARPLRSP